MFKVDLEKAEETYQIANSWIIEKTREFKKKSIVEKWLC